MPKIIDIREGVVSGQFPMEYMYILARGGVYFQTKPKLCLHFGGIVKVI